MCPQTGWGQGTNFVEGIVYYLLHGLAHPPNLAKQNFRLSTKNGLSTLLEWKIRMGALVPKLTGV